MVSVFEQLLMNLFREGRPGNNRLNNRISESISASVTPLHVCLEEPREPELGLCDTNALGSKAERNHKIRENRRESGTYEETGTELLQSGTTSELKQNQSMSNPLKNVNMTNPIKGIVSKRRVRYKDYGFDLDLTYITSNLIAMGFPAEKLEGCYRNHIDDVVKLLEKSHKDHYYVYNLCSERSYDGRKFNNRVSVYAFDDHHPPPINLIKPFCDDVHKWLSEDPKNVAAIHCKAGKGRTGVMVSCYLLHSKLFTTASEALHYYGSKRTTDNKGVTIPSQRRYVNYYATLVKENFNYEPTKLILREIKLDPPPILNGGQGCYRFVISEGNNKLFTSEQYEIQKGTSSLRITLSESLAITGDIRVEFFLLPKVKRKEKLFHFWFNTYFVRESCDNNGGPIERTTRALSCDGSAMEFQSIILTKPRTGSLANINPSAQALVLTLNKMEIDKAHKDKSNKIFSSDFKVSLLMHREDNAIIPSNVLATPAAQQGPAEERIQVGVAQGQESNDESSDSGDTTGGESTADEDGWESGESRSPDKTKNLHPRHTRTQNTTTPTTPTTPPKPQQMTKQHVDSINIVVKELAQLSPQKLSPQKQSPQKLSPQKPSPQKVSPQKQKFSPNITGFFKRL